MHASGQDLEVFRHSVGVVPDDLFDTQIAASFLGMSSVGLAPLVHKLVGADLPKADRLTDWLVRPLPERAKVYAESDVVHLFELHDLLTAELEARGRMGWVKSESDALVARALVDNDPDTAWWRVKEARRLNGRAAAVAQEVAKWREEQARRSDRPLRSVLPDLALAGIAQRPPRDVDALTKVRGLRDRGIPKALRGELLEAIEAGLDLDLDRVRQPTSAPVPGELRAAIPLLMSWVTQRARELELDPAVLATRTDLESFLRGDESSRLAVGWRAEALAEEIGALLDGRAALSFERGVGLVLRRDDSA
jgi:ribonuclease D